MIVTGSAHTQNEDEESDDSHIATRGHSSQEPIAGVTSLREDMVEQELLFPS